jgi:hypothetical protein
MADDWPVLAAGDCHGWVDATGAGGCAIHGSETAARGCGIGGRAIGGGGGGTGPGTGQLICAKAEAGRVIALSASKAWRMVTPL